MRSATIAAISTPLGEGGIGVIRISGPEALPVADRVVRLAGGRRLSAQQPRTVQYGRAVAADESDIDEVIVFFFRAPRSYTREDLVEIQGHGGTIVLHRLLEAVLAAGAALAEPGEFTERAVRNGRLTLAQAEAVIDLIRAKTEAASRAALQRLAGEGGRELQEVEGEILACLAEIEASLDFPEDVPAPERRMIAEKARDATSRLAETIAGAARGRLLREGAMVVLAGRPNVGKSSLLNALLGEERALVTPLPGTTRDAVAEEFSLGGIPVRLVDTAGLGEAGDAMEALSMERTRRELSRADLILLVVAGDEEISPADEDAAAEAAAGERGVVVVNKTDRPQVLTRMPAAAKVWPVVRVSALTGEGLAELVGTIERSLGGALIEGTPLLGRTRQIQAAREAQASLSTFVAGLETGLPMDILAEDLRACLNALGRLTGRALGPELMREVFSRFCVGK